MEMNVIFRFDIYYYTSSMAFESILFATKILQNFVRVDIIEL